MVAALLLATLLQTAPAAPHEPQEAPHTPTEVAPDLTEPQVPIFTTLEQRFELERKARRARFAFTPYAPNYILLASYTDSIQESSPSGRDPQSVETKFQVSFKTRIANGVLGRDNALWFGYTQLSLWQLYDSKNSSPFRETNYQPELLWMAPLDEPLLGARLRMLSFGVNHQSNGQTDPFSRSWNRFIAGAIVEHDDDVFLVRGWARIPESSSQDDNPGIERNIGVAELTWIHTFEKQRLALTLRSNLEPDQPRGSAQLDWSFALSETLRGYVQAFSGYGETLIDYDNPQTRIGVGLMLADWF